MYLVAELLGWMEVIRRKVVFISGKKAATLNQILDDIKFQFSGETEVQGWPAAERANPDIETGTSAGTSAATSAGTSAATSAGTSAALPAAPNRVVDVDREPWSVFQLFGVEMRAIGEVMLDVRSAEDGCLPSNDLSVIGYAEFVRRYTKQEPKRHDFTSEMDERATKTITDVGVAAAAAPSGPDDLRERDNRRALAPAPTSAVLDGAAPRSGGMTLQQMKKHASVDVADSKYGEALQKWNASKEKMMQVWS
ncbi:hypothetical protein PLESTB_000892000 [Pleodorina starrii]|uniref:Uncharacterized protein n=1 Tax=Pleodorina starrii TaxID=330485 RepID=A0A9W6BMV4_9CHLO|nr:hypothetical protein PLESTB_000892000 [Pleodorina starrii]